MKKAIWKFPLKMTAYYQTIEMPTGARIVYVGINPGDEGRRGAIWAEVETALPTEKRYFFIVGTGQPIPEGTTYIGTYDQSPFIWHIYEKG